MLLSIRATLLNVSRLIVPWQIAFPKLKGIGLLIFVLPELSIVN
jgi:hypothetical protein